MPFYIYKRWDKTVSVCTWKCYSIHSWDVSSREDVFFTSITLEAKFYSFFLHRKIHLKVRDNSEATRCKLFHYQGNPWEDCEVTHSGSWSKHGRAPWQRGHHTCVVSVNRHSGRCSDDHIWSTWKLSLHCRAKLEKIIPTLRLTIFYFLISK